MQRWLAAGWHERNDGNLTYRMKEEEVAQCRLFFDPQPREWVNMGVQADNLAGEYFITTGSGKFFRNVEPDPVHSIGIVEITKRATAGASSGAWRTAQSHIRVSQPLYEPQCPQGCHQWRKPRYLHCHATNVIALTYILPLTDRDFTRALWQSATECPVVFPEAWVSARGWCPAGQTLPWPPVS